MYTIITLINIENRNIIRNLGVFIQKAFANRECIYSDLADIMKHSHMISHVHK